MMKRKPKNYNDAGNHLEDFQRKTIIEDFIDEHIIMNTCEGDVLETNSALGSFMSDMPGFVTLKPMLRMCSKEPYLLGSYANREVRVDPNMSWNDCRLFVYRFADGEKECLLELTQEQIRRII